MDDTQAKGKAAARGHSRRGFALPRALVVGVAGLLLLGLLAHLTASLASNRALERQLQAIRARQEPLSLAEAAPPAVPDAVNAALVYQEAFRTLPKPDRVSALGDDLVAYLSEDAAKRRGLDAREVVRLLAPYQRSLALARRAAGMPRCRFPVNWEAGGGALFPHLSGLRNLGRLLLARAVAYAELGRARGAVGDLKAALGVVRHLGADPSLLNQVSQYAALRTTHNALKRVAGAAPLDEPAARGLGEELDRVDLGGTLVRALEGDRALGLWAFDAVRHNPGQFSNLVAGGGSGGPDQDLLTRLGSSALWRPVLKMDESFYLGFMESQLARARQPAPLLQEAAPRPIPRYALVSSVMTPAMGALFRKRDEALTRLLLDHWILALSLYRSRHGHLPATLSEVRDDVGWKLPLDPYSGGEFVYRPTGDQFRLYSVGSNRRDDGGRTAAPDQPERIGTTRSPSSQPDDIR